MKFFKPLTVSEELSKIRYDGISKGLDTGWKCLDEIFTVKKGYPLFIAGSPHHGKTEFTLELLINLSKSFGWKHFVYSGESGSCAELITELCHKFIGKPYRKKLDKNIENDYAMTEGERTMAEMFIDNHFVFLDTEHEKSSVLDFNIKQFYELVDNAEQEFNIKFDTTLIDPFNDVVMNLNEYGGRQDLWLTDSLRIVRRDAKRNNRLNIIVNHISDIASIKHSSGAWYTPPAKPSQWSGGQTWHRRAFTMLLIYRPPSFLTKDTGKPYDKNETVVINQKSKPKGTGKLGEISLFWDWKTNKYYENNSSLYTDTANGVHVSEEEDSF